MGLRFVPSSFLDDTATYVFFGSTNDNTQTELFVNGVAGSRVVLDNNTILLFTLRIGGRKTDISDVYDVFIQGTIKRTIDATHIFFVETPQANEISGRNLGWVADVYADTSNGALSVRVTGKTGASIDWVAQLKFVQIQ